MISGLSPTRSNVFRKVIYTLFLGSSLLLISIFLSSFSIAHAAERPVPSQRFPIIGLHGGYSFVSGYFEEDLTGGPSLGLFVVPWMWKYFMIDTELSWNYLNVENSPKSYVMLSALTAGTLMRWPVFSRIDLFAGFFMRGSYLYFHGENSGETAWALKVGFGGTAGMFIRIYRRIEMRVTYRFSQNDLSNRSFMSHELLAGCGYAFPVKAPPDTASAVPYRKIKHHYNEGKELFEGGSFKPALEQFNRVLTLDEEHVDAENYIRKITLSLAHYDRAMELKKEKKFFGAIRYLKKCDPRMSLAKKELREVRALLKGQVDPLERAMIKLYNEKKYRECIQQGKKILLVDPDNRKAPLYIRRARRRYDAYRKFQ